MVDDRSASWPASSDWRSKRPRVVDHEGGKSGDRLPHANALVVEIGVLAGLVEHGHAEELALSDERQDEDLAGPELLELVAVDPLAVGRQHQGLAQTAQLRAHAPLPVAERSGQDGARGGGQAQVIVVDQQDGAARHADRRGELLGHRAEQVMEIERGGKVGGHTAQHAGRRREGRQGVTHAGGGTAAQGEQQGESADRGQPEHGRNQLVATADREQAEEQQGTRRRPWRRPPAT